MDTVTISLIILTITMLITTWLAHRQGNERRDIQMMSAISGLLGIGLLASAIG